MAEEEPAGEDPAGRMRAGYARAEEKNQRAREALAPLNKGERPTVVTVGAVFCAVFWVFESGGWRIDSQAAAPSGVFL